MKWRSPELPFCTVNDWPPSSRRPRIPLLVRVSPARKFTFKAKAYALAAAAQDELAAAWEDQFDRLFGYLGVADTKQYVEKFVKPVKIAPALKDYVKDAAEAEDVSDLAD